MEVSNTFTYIKSISFTYQYFSDSFSFRIKHILKVPNGNWTVRVRASNKEGWSTFSNEKEFIITGLY